MATIHDVIDPGVWAELDTLPVCPFCGMGWKQLARSVGGHVAADAYVRHVIRYHLGQRASWHCWCGEISYLWWHQDAPVRFLMHCRDAHGGMLEHAVACSTFP